MAAVRSSGLALLALRCPHCHTGKLFSRSALSLRHFDEMPEACPVCQQHYEPEPGFYWGAMYISFGFSTGIMLAVGVLIYYLLHNPDTWVYVGAVTAVTLLLAPLSFRYARAVMLYAFGGIDFDPRYADKTATSAPGGNSAAS